MSFVFIFNDTATHEIYQYLPTLSTHDALPSSRQGLEGSTHAPEGIGVEDLPAPERAALHLGEPRLHNNLRPGHEDRLDLVLDDVARRFLTQQKLAARRNACRQPRRAIVARPEERRVGKELVSPCTYRWTPRL